MLRGLTVKKVLGIGVLALLLGLGGLSAQSQQPRDLTVRTLMVLDRFLLQGYGDHFVQIRKDIRNNRPGVDLWVNGGGVSIWNHPDTASPLLIKGNKCTSVECYSSEAVFTVDADGNLRAQTKSFVVTDPTDPTKEIVYTSLEGPEAGTYIRGTAQLVNGEAIINLPEHFSLVTSEEGLTVQLTPLGECNGLYVAKKSTAQIIVKELLGGRSDAKFDYLVQGIRKGYEGYQVIREKRK